MGKDNQPKERQKNGLARKREKRSTYDRILIVCEGTKTEPNYFKEIQVHFRLQTANVQVEPSQLGTSPSKLSSTRAIYFSMGTYIKVSRRNLSIKSSLCSIGMITSITMRRCNLLRL